MTAVSPADKDAFFSDVEAAAKKAIWCALATVDGNAPRVRMVHPTWEGDVLWVATGPTTPKATQIQANGEVDVIAEGLPYSNGIAARGNQVFVANSMGENVVMIERTEDGWSEVKSLGPSFEEIEIMRLTASSKGTYVFDEIGSEDGNGVLRYSRLIDGAREEPRPFNEEINSGKFNAHPFIAPDESYLIWDCRRDDGYGGSDIYISYRQQDGSWGPAINLGGEINSEGWDAAASVTPDGKYLFFHRLNDAGNANIYWVDAQIIETLRPKS